MRRTLVALVSFTLMGCPDSSNTTSTSNYSSTPALNYSAPTRPDNSNAVETESLDLSTPEKAIYTAIDLAVNDDPRYQQASMDRMQDKFGKRAMRKLHGRLDGLREIKRQEKNGYELVRYRAVDAEGKEFGTIKVTKKIGQDEWKITD